MSLVFLVFLLKVSWLWYVAFLRYTCSDSPGTRSKHDNPLIGTFKQDPPRLIWKDTFLSFLPTINNYQPNVWRCKWIMARRQPEQRPIRQIIFSFCDQWSNILCMQPNIIFPIDLLPMYRIQYLGSGYRMSINHLLHKHRFSHQNLGRAGCGGVCL